MQERNRIVVKQFRPGGEIDGLHRERLGAIVAATYPFFADHQLKAGRPIPVVVLTRVTEPA